MNAVAVITDIHANLPALQAALARIDELGVERIYCGGDLVGYGPHPNDVCALIAEREIPTIYGNYDYAIARDLDDCGCAYVDQRDRELGQKSVEWTLAHTDRAAKDFMRELPFDLHFELNERRVHLVHGSPRKGQRVPLRGQAGPPVRTPGRSRGRGCARVRPHAQALDARVRRGAVRQLRLGRQTQGRRPRAAFAVLDLDDAAEVHARIERVAYDADTVAAEVREAGLPAEYADKLLAAA